MYLKIKLIEDKQLCSYSSLIIKSALNTTTYLSCNNKLYLPVSNLMDHNEAICTNLGKKVMVFTLLTS